MKIPQPPAWLIPTALALWNPSAVSAASNFETRELAPAASQTHLDITIVIPEFIRLGPNGVLVNGSPEEAHTHVAQALSIRPIAVVGNVGTILITSTYLSDSNRLSSSESAVSDQSIKAGSYLAAVP